MTTSETGTVTLQIPGTPSNPIANVICVEVEGEKVVRWSNLPTRAGPAG